MKKYVFEQFNPRGGIGEEKIFETENEAMDCALYFWHRMTKNDKNQYLNAPTGYGQCYLVYEIEISEKDYNEYLDEYSDEVVNLNEYWTREIYNFIKNPEI